MAQFEGMDVEAVQSAGAHLKAQSETLESIVRAVDSLVSHLIGVWHGSDATAFHGWWQQNHRPAMLEVAASVAGLGQSALHNSADQEVVSGQSPSGALGRGGVAGKSPLSTPVPGAASTLHRSLDDALDTPLFTGVMAGGGLLTSALSFAEHERGVGPFSVLGLAVDGYRTIDSASDGNYGGASVDGLLVAADVTGMVFPEVGLGVAAFQGGAWIGSEAATHLHTADLTYSEIAYDKYGSAGPNEAQAQDLVQRYSGPTGIVHYGSDLVGADARSLGHLVRNL